MNARAISEAWAAKVRLADQAGPNGYRHIMEEALKSAMQRAIPALPAPAKGCEWLTVAWSTLGGQEVSVEWDMHEGVTCRVYTNGIDITELVPTDSDSLEQQAYAVAMAERSAA